MRKKISLLLFGVMAVCLLAAFIPFKSALADEVKTTEYKYALLGDYYTIENGLVSAKNPRGENISASDKKVFLDWAQGSYVFEYANKIVNLKVYESAPEDTIKYGGKLPESGVAGEPLNFPSAKVISGIKRTDGAPEVGEYAVHVEIWHKGAKVYSASDIQDGFSFTPEDGGFWVAAYRYTDVFGRERSVESVFSVENRRIIVTDIQTEYFIGDSLSLSGTYGFYAGERYDVTARMILPSGEEMVLTDNYVFPESGEYTLKLTSTAQGTTAEKEIKIRVNAGLASFVANQNGLTQAKTFKNHKNVVNVSEYGLLYDMTASGSSFTYNGIIDLKKLGKNTPVISFTTNNSYGGSLSAVEVTLTDVYDSKRSVTVRFAKNSDITETSLSYDNTLVRAMFGSVSAAFNNYYPLKTDAVAWDTRFSAYWLSSANTNPDKTYDPAEKMYPMNFAYDYTENVIYSYGNYAWIGRPDGSESGEKWYKTADLNAASLPVKFQGFTTGEVYLSVKAVTGRGDIVVQSIGGRFAVTDSDYSTNEAVLTGAFDNTVTALVGKEYPLSAYPNQYIKDLKVTVTDQSGKKTEVTGGYFVPDKAGVYKVEFSGMNVFGKTVFKSLTFECVSEKIATEIAYQTQDVKYGAVYMINAPTVTGGHGKVTYKMFYNGEEVTPGDRVLIEERAVIVIKTTDSLGFTSEKTFELPIDKAALEFIIDFPTAAVKGSEFVFPKAKVKYLLTGETVDYSVYTDGVLCGEKVVLPTDKKSVSIEYRTAYGSKEYTLYLVGTNVDSLIFDGEKSLDGEGTKITLNGNSLKMPYKLSPNALRTEIFVLAEDLNFNSASLILTDKNGVAVKIGIIDLKKDNPQYAVNDEATGVSVAKRKQTFSSTAGNYANKEYYAFSIAYENRYKAVLNGNRIMAYVEKDTRGITFNGFNDGVYAELVFGEATGNIAFTLTRVSNQYFYDYSLEDGDSTGPALFSEKTPLNNANVAKGYKLDLSDLRAFDVLQGEGKIVLSLTAPSGKTVLDNVTPENAKYTLSEFGTYLLRITATDNAGSRTTATYRIAVEDTEAPELTVANGMPSKAKKGEKVVLCSASANDQSQVTVTVYLFMPNGKVITLGSGKGSVSALTFTASGSGVYRAVYVAEDEYGNATLKTFNIIAED